MDVIGRKVLNSKKGGTITASMDDCLILDDSNLIQVVVEVDANETSAPNSNQEEDICRTQLK